MDGAREVDVIGGQGKGGMHCPEGIPIVLRLVAPRVVMLSDPQCTSIAVEASLTLPFLTKEVEVDVSDRSVRPHREMRPRGKLPSKFVGCRLTVPDKANRTFAPAVGGVSTGGVATRKRRLNEQLAIRGPPHRNG